MTQDTKLHQWWDSLTVDQRQSLLDADLERPLDAGLVDVVVRARVTAPAIGSWWVSTGDGPTWHATPKVRDFVETKRDRV